MSDKSRKFGRNHAKAMLYQGLAELGNAVVNSSDLTQRHLGHGIYGLEDPRPENLNKLKPDTPIVDAHIRDAQGRSRVAAERNVSMDRVPEIDIDD